MFLRLCRFVLAAFVLLNVAAAAEEPLLRNVPFGVHRDGTAMLAVVDVRAKVDSTRPQVLVVDRRRPANVDVLQSVSKALSVSIAFAPLKGHDSRGLTFAPPQGGYYDDKTDPESRYLWRWIGMRAPDLVVEVVQGDGETWFVPQSDLPQLQALAKSLPNVVELPAGNDLVSHLVRVAPCGTGVVPAVRVAASGFEFVHSLAKAIESAKLPPSPARQEISKRLKRTPREVSDQLLEHYGKQLPAVQYIPALALVGRLRHERNVGGDDVPISPIVLAAIEPYVRGAKPALDAKANGSTFSGHLIFAELAERTGEAKYVVLVKAAADRAFNDDGSPREAMPSHNEMSDATFMGSPILAAAGKLTGDEKYYGACLRNVRFIQKLCLRDDGIYRHSPIDEAAWGRGNGFPALGLTWALDFLPESFAGRSEIAASLEKHLTTLLKYQDHNGCWHQVIDKPESYAEFTCTAMITYAMARGVRLGRLDEQTFGDAIRRGWNAVKTRTAADGSLVDVCTGTGKQKSLRDYYDRPAILGRDDRGGAMALMIATEMELYLQK